MRSMTVSCGYKVRGKFSTP